MIHARHPQAVITKVEKTTVGDKVTYEVSARQGRRRFSLEFDSSGKAIEGKAGSVLIIIVPGQQLKLLDDFN